jgi:hypothetical protein
VGVEQSEVQQPKAQAKSRDSHWTVAERYGSLKALSTARSCQGFHHFDRFFALPRRHDWASVPPPKTVGFEAKNSPDFEDKDFP